MATTNLTNTTWNIPAGWTCSASYGTFNIEGNINDRYFQGGVGFGKGNWNEDEFPNASNSIAYWSSDGAVAYYTSNTPLTFTITGGADVTNSSLISWLEANGTLVTNTNSINGKDYLFQTIKWDDFGFDLSVNPGTPNASHKANWDKFVQKMSPYCEIKYINKGNVDAFYPGAWYIYFTNNQLHWNSEYVDITISPIGPYTVIARNTNHVSNDKKYLDFSTALTLTSDGTGSSTFYINISEFNPGMSRFDLYLYDSSRVYVASDFENLIESEPSGKGQPASLKAKAIYGTNLGKDMQYYIADNYSFKKDNNKYNMQGWSILGVPNDKGLKESEYPSEEKEKIYGYNINQIESKQFNLGLYPKEIYYSGGANGWEPPLLEEGEVAILYRFNAIKGNVKVKFEQDFSNTTSDKGGYYTPYWEFNFTTPVTIPFSTYKLINNRELEETTSEYYRAIIHFNHFTKTKTEKITVKKNVNHVGNFPADLSKAEEVTLTFKYNIYYPELFNFNPGTYNIPLYDPEEDCGLGYIYIATLGGYSKYDYFRYPKTAGAEWTLEPVTIYEPSNILFDWNREYVSIINDYTEELQIDYSKKDADWSWFKSLEIKNDVTDTDKEIYGYNQKAGEANGVAFSWGETKRRMFFNYIPHNNINSKVDLIIIWTPHPVVEPENILEFDIKRAVSSENTGINYITTVANVYDKDIQYRFSDRQNFSLISPLNRREYKIELNKFSSMLLIYIDPYTNEQKSIPLIQTLGTQ